MLQFPRGRYEVPRVGLVAVGDSRAAVPRQWHLKLWEVARGCTSTVLRAPDLAHGDTNPMHSLTNKAQGFTLGVRSMVGG